MDLIRVPPEALEDLAGRMDAVCQDVQAARCAVEAAEYVLGSGVVAKALDEFSDSWKKKREEIIKSMGEASKFLRNAAESFLTVDREHAQQLLSGGTGGESR